jgi:hypothetical protein
MQTAEQAYELLANELLEYSADCNWISAGSVVSIFGKMTQTSYWRRIGDEVIENDRFPSLNTATTASRASLFLRDELLNTTGQRIWGLTFTLYPDGKFNIEYDYEKPEGYEESDETIDVSLTDFADRINKK